jgi:hypothetical protein
MIATLVVRSRPITVSLALLLATSGLGPAAPQAAQPQSAQPQTTGESCTAEAATLAREESDLPRIEVTSAKDRPVLCITIETLMAFTTRLKAHIARCPDSAHAASTAKWEKARVDYSKQFTQNRCRRTLPN